MAGNASVPGLFVAHFFHLLNPPAYFFTVAGALLRRAIVGRVSAIFFNSWVIDVTQFGPDGLREDIWKNVILVIIESGALPKKPL